MTGREQVFSVREYLSRQLRERRGKDEEEAEAKKRGRSGSWRIWRNMTEGQRPTRQSSTELRQRGNY
jgi:hypothetical protein